MCIYLGGSYVSRERAGGSSARKNSAAHPVTGIRKIVFAPKRPRGAGRKACLTAGKQAFLAALRAVLGRKATGAKISFPPPPFLFCPLPFGHKILL